MQFYADENFPLAAVIELRRLGHDVLTAFEDGRANKSIEDSKVLARSAKLKRVILTINRLDFKRLHNSGNPHSGIFICTFDADFVGLATRIHACCDDEDDYSGKLVSITRPNR